MMLFTGKTLPPKTFQLTWISTLNVIIKVLIQKIFQKKLDKGGQIFVLL